MSRQLTREVSKQEFSANAALIEDEMAEIGAVSLFDLNFIIK